MRPRQVVARLQAVEEELKSIQSELSRNRRVAHVVPIVKNAASQTETAWQVLNETMRSKPWKG